MYQRGDVRVLSSSPPVVRIRIFFSSRVPLETHKQFKVSSNKTKIFQSMHEFICIHVLIT